MTNEEAKTALVLLGLKIKRSRWKGYMYVSRGSIYKYNSETEHAFHIHDVDFWIYDEGDLRTFGKWEIVND